jgi:SAF domain
VSGQPPAGVGTAYFPAADVPPNGGASNGSAPNGSTRFVSPPEPGRLRSLPRRRRPAVLALSIALAGAGMLIGTTVYAQASHQVPVVVVTAVVPAGAVITSGDLGTADVAVPSGVPVIPAGQLDQVSGQTAAESLQPGMLLASAQLTSARPPGPGQVLVPVPLKPESLPASGLAPGDQVLVIGTPGDQGQPGSSSTATSLSAPVPAVVEAISTVTDQDGFDVVDLLVAKQDGEPVAAQASTGEIALIVTKRGP